jgi:antitoxin component of MazEF toxin-antitoxin module
MTQKIIRTGHSAAVTIPAKFFKALNLRIGDHVVAAADYMGGTLIYKFQEIRQLRLAAPEESTSLAVARKKKPPVKKAKR